MPATQSDHPVTRPTVVVLCVHGQAKACGRTLARYDSNIQELRRSICCPGGRVLNQAIIIEIESVRLPGETSDSFFYPRWACDAVEGQGVVAYEALLDALASAQETR